MSAAREITDPSEVIIAPKPTVVTFMPVFPRVLNFKTAPLDGALADGACCACPVNLEADAAAGSANPAARKLRRDELRFIYASKKGSKGDTLLF
jgi:hypothetical protein